MLRIDIHCLGAMLWSFRSYHILFLYLFIDFFSFIYIFNINYYYIWLKIYIICVGAIVVVIVSVPITPTVVSSNPVQARCTRYNIMWLSLSVTCGRLVVFSGYSGFLHRYKWPPQFNWNIVASCIKHHDYNPIFRRVTSRQYISITSICIFASNTFLGFFFLQRRGSNERNLEFVTF